MKKTLSIYTTNELAYIDGNVLFDDCISVIRSIMGANRMGRLDLNSDPIEGYTKAQEIGKVGNTTQYKSKHGIFSVCNKSVNGFGLGKLFYYKINR